MSRRRSHATIGKAERLIKERHPHRYCANGRCLWRISSGPCPKHGMRSERGGRP